MKKEFKIGQIYKDKTGRQGIVIEDNVEGYEDDDSFMLARLHLTKGTGWCGSNQGLDSSKEYWNISNICVDNNEWIQISTKNIVGGELL